EAAKTGMIHSRPVLIHPRSSIFPASEQEPIAVCTGRDLGSRPIIKDRSTKDVVTVFLDDVTTGVCKMRYTAFMVLVQKIPMPLVICPVCSPFNNFVDSFTVHIE